MSAKYRMIGTTDDVIDCEKCGKPELRMTVVLEMLDADGNGEGVTYYGTTCAARALAARGVRTTAAKVRDEARFAQQQRERDRDYALQSLAVFNLPLDGVIDPEVWQAAVLLFQDRNRQWGTTKRPIEWAEQSLTECMTKWRAQAAA